MTRACVWRYPVLCCACDTAGEVICDTRLARVHMESWPELGMRLLYKNTAV